MATVRLEEIVARLGGVLIGGHSRPIRQVATLGCAGPDEISFLANPRYQSQLSATRAGAVILSAASANSCPVACIVSDDPYLYFARVAQWLNPATESPPGIHPSASVESAVPNNASIGAGVSIGPASVIGERARIGAGCVIGTGVELGDDVLLHANVTIYAGCRIGARVIIHSGAVIGADGFGFARDAQGVWVKIPQIGRVVIGNDVEIGANTTIDRGALDDTVLEDGVKLDNQIQIGHNVRVGAHSALAGCVGIAGSTRLGRRCTVGGGAVILGHLVIADDVNISAATLVTKSIAMAGLYSGGVPIQAHGEWLRNFAHLRHLDAMADRIRALETQLAQMKRYPAGESDKAEEKQ